ncbi:hypothetical protein [Carnobacterium funditum]|uniref:hypothetical protein n=1 Tax=Carnobacterium funditum TaxID=2752 RepID=UPI0005530F55|nr:hypothetical protein [Carnobacterium funditum]
MNFKEFVAYMEQNLSAKDAFYQKALDDQVARNVRRAPAKKWNEAKMDRAVDKLWLELMKNVYDKFKWVVKENSSDPRKSWIEYIEKTESLESLDEMLVELEFE